MMDMPYFMTEKKWYRFDLEKGKYVLTDETPDEAKESYVEFYETLERDLNWHV